MAENFLHNSESAYYKRSGGAPLVGVLLMLLISGAVAFALAFPYAWATDFNPMVFINLIVTFLVGGFFAVVIEQSGKAFHVHNRIAYTIIALIVALFFVYAQWAAYISVNYSRNGQFSGFLELMLAPQLLWKYINSVNAKGLWSIGSTVPTGLLLWLVWLIEAGIVVITTSLCKKFVKETPYSKQTKTWMIPTTSFVCFKFVADNKEYVAPLEKGDLSALMNLELAPDTDPNFAELTWFTAGNDPNMYFTLNNAIITFKDNKPQKKLEPVFALLRVPVEQGMKIVKSVEALERMEQEGEQVWLDAEEAGQSEE